VNLLKVEYHPSNEQERQTKTMDKKIINFDIKGDDRGSLISLETNSNIPFYIKRVYYIFGNKPNVVRGKHAHKNLAQVLVCVSGFVKIKLDDGKETEEIYLDKPDKGLYIKGLIWREMSEFSNDCVLVVLASESYDESDYIRNYDEFLKVVHQKEEQ
jgi:dTDP-4-dehydrorhamnose 3,5-epimerase-like enzyme